MLWDRGEGFRIKMRISEVYSLSNRLLNIQKLQFIKPSGKEYRLVTLMALREACERHHDLNGGDPYVSAKAAGHSKETKARITKR